MIILSYDTAKRSLLMMSLYLIGASLVIKGLGYLLEFNFLSAFQSLLNGTDVSLQLPEFNLDSFSFDFILNTIQGKIQEILQTIIPAATTILGSAQSIDFVAIKKPGLVRA